MVLNLPHGARGGFKWVGNHDKFIDESYINNVNEDAKEGFILEVDLEYRNEIHDSHE